MERSSLSWFPFSLSLSYPEERKKKETFLRKGGESFRFGWQEQKIFQEKRSSVVESIFFHCHTALRTRGYISQRTPAVLIRSNSSWPHLQVNLELFPYFTDKRLNGIFNSVTVSASSTVCQNILDLESGLKGPQRSKVIEENDLSSTSPTVVLQWFMVTPGFF